MIINENLLNKVFKENYHELFKFAKSQIRNEVDANQISLEAFAKLWLHQASVKEEAHIRPYLFVTVRNQCIDYHKKRHDKPLEDAIHNLPLAQEPTVYKKFTEK